MLFKTPQSLTSSWTELRRPSLLGGYSKAAYLPSTSPCFLEIWNCGNFLPRWSSRLGQFKVEQAFLDGKLEEALKFKSNMLPLLYVKKKSIICDSVVNLHWETANIFIHHNNLNTFPPKLFCLHLYFTFPPTKWGALYYFYFILF